MASTKIHSLSRVKGESQPDSVARAKSLGGNRAYSILMEAQQYWLSMETFRKDRERNKNYTYGKQWDDVICVDGKLMKEESYIKSQGNIPLKNNLVRRMVRSILGVYRSQAKEPTCFARDRDEQRYSETMSTVLQCNMQLNRMTEVNARSLEEFLISGFIVHRKWFGWRNNKLDNWTDYVQPNNFFIDNNMRDFRAWDVSCVGEIHDISFETLCERFARTAEDYTHLAEIYSFARDKDVLGMTYDQFGYPLQGYYDFLVPFDTSRCRVIEVWRKECKPRYRCHDMNNGDIFKIDIEDYDELVGKINRERLQQGQEAGMPTDDIPLVKAEWFMDSYWYYYYLTPFGDILDEGETPYDHKSHPYVFMAYPFIDGEIHSYVSDVIDQQRYVNRLITLYDWIMRASAKGVLLFPETCLPKGWDLKDVADEWSRFDGVIGIQVKPGVPLPQQIANNSTNIGIAELLNMQLKLFEDISGVNGALQGKPGYSGMSASLYNQQTQNATTSLLDLLDSFSAFIREGAYKDVKNMQQFYDGKRVFNIAGKSGTQIVYDPKKIRDVEFDLSITESTSTPAYRAITNDMLMQLWQSQAISVEQLLEHGDFPFADELLQSIKSQREQIAAGQIPEGLSPELMQRVQQGADMDAVDRANAALKTIR
ncbi:MAG: hypothetical protein IJY31_06065 [Muribaculaceae bacterium]|nr:hypothetical protein [Muribaculaceae bacterium]